MKTATCNVNRLEAKIRGVVVNIRRSRVGAIVTFMGNQRYVVRSAAHVMDVAYIVASFLHTPQSEYVRGEAGRRDHASIRREVASLIRLFV